MKSAIPWIIFLAILFALLAFMIPSSVPLAMGESLPYYDPVELTNPDIDPIPMDASTPYQPHEEGWFADGSGYRDGTIYVKIESRQLGATTVWFTWVQIADPSQLRTTLWRRYPSKQTVFVTSMAEREHGVVTINGDYCVDRTQGVVIRNGVTLRKARATQWDCMLIDGNGDMHIYRAPVPDNYDDFDGEILQAFVFGPALVIDGVLQTEFTEMCMRRTGGYGKAQRQVFCQMDKLSYLIITTEGPEENPRGGMTMAEVASLAYEMGAQEAFNLDGGSSAWLVLNTRRINALVGKKRTIADAIYFITGEETYSMGSAAED